MPWRPRAGSGGRDRLPGTGPGEIGAHERAVDVMGASLERSRDELATLADEQAALRRVATLVAGGPPPDAVFSAVAEELGRLLSADRTVVGRYDSDGAATVVGAWSQPGAGAPIPIGRQLERGGRNLHTLVFQTGRPARIDDYADATGRAATLPADGGSARPSARRSTSKAGCGAS